MINALPELAILEERFYLDANGDLRSKVKGRRVKIDQLVGHVSSTDGYRYVGVNYGRYLAHRIVWKMFYKEEPPTTIDHIDGNRLNNLPTNLRSCSTLENLRNKTKVRNNASGHTGVYVYFGKKRTMYYAQIKTAEKMINLGTFDSLEKAVEVRRTAEKIYFGEFAPKKQG